MINRSESALIAQERRNLANKTPKTSSRETVKVNAKAPRRKDRKTH